MIEIKSFTFNPFQENMYVLSDKTKECIIIDPGCYTPQEEAQLSQYIEVEGLKPVRLINTHCHIDHVVGNAYVSKSYGLELEAHQLETPILESIEMQAKYYGFEIKTSPKIMHYIDEKTEITFGESTLKSLFTPGHCPGELSFYNEAQKFIIGGDVLFQLSIGRTDLPGGDHATLINSIKEQFFPLGDDYIVHPGHGPSTNIGFERANNPFLQ